MARPHNASQRAVRVLCIRACIRFQDSERNSYIYIYILHKYLYYIYVYIYICGRIALKKCKARKDEYAALSKNA